MKLLFILSALMISACGMQGDLYLPDDGPEARTGNSVQTDPAQTE